MDGLPAALALIQGYEWLVILVVALLLFGATRLPKLARAMGSSVNEFKKGMKDGAETPAEPQETTEAKK